MIRIKKLLDLARDIVLHGDSRPVMANIQWKCKTPHTNCEAQDWKHYKNMTASDAIDFMATKAPKSRMFDYRIAPEEDSKPASQ